MGNLMRVIKWLCYRLPCGTPDPQNTPFFAFFVAFHIFVVSKRILDFIFDIQGDRSSQPTDDKPSMKRAWLRHVTRFKFWGPHPYLRNSWS